MRGWRNAAQVPHPLFPPSRTRGAGEGHFFQTRLEVLETFAEHLGRACADVGTVFCSEHSLQRLALFKVQSMRLYNAFDNKGRGESGVGGWGGVGAG